MRNCVQPQVRARFVRFNQRWAALIAVSAL